MCHKRGSQVVADAGACLALGGSASSLNDPGKVITASRKRFSRIIILKTLFTKYYS
jgi:hypothetical protein